MSYLSRFLTGKGQRAYYSSFFSSKPGGGRYFNSSKPPKPPGVSKQKRVITEGTDGQTAATTTTNNVQSGAETKSVETAVGGAAAAEEQAGKNAKSGTTNSGEPSSSRIQTSPTSMFDGSALMPPPSMSHPSITPQQFKLHQFFSLHRPLLLLSDPASILRDAPPLFSRPPAQQQQQTSGSHGLFGLDQSPAIDADAEAARQLTRAISITRGGGAMAWEDTLRHLGLDLSQEAERVDMHAKLADEWKEVQMESTRRKKKKKMKKHKLKKRRKATRSQRLRLKSG